MSFKYLLPLFIIALVFGSGCVVPYVDDILPSSGMTASPVNETLTAYSTAGYWKSISINKQQYTVGITKQTDGIKYLISPPGYPYGYEGVLTSGATKTIVISNEKLNEMKGFSASIWDVGGIWRVGDTFTLTCSGDTVNVKWTQTGNTDPTITSFNVAPSATVGTGDSIEITADWNSGGDSDLIFNEWYLDGKVANGWIYVTPEIDEKRLRINGLPEGTHIVKLEVWDSGKNLVTKTQTLTVAYGTANPTATISVLSCGQFGCTPSNSITYGNGITLQSYSTANLQDPNLQNLTHTWYLDGNQLGSQFYVDTLGYQVNVPDAMATLGTHTVRLVVKNASQLASENTVAFNVVTPTTPTDPTVPVVLTCPTCADGEHCVNGQCVPLPEASPLPSGTFTITCYNNQVAEMNGYQLRYRNTVAGRNDPSYQYISLNVEELSLNYMGVYTMEEWRPGFTISVNPASPDYSIIYNNPIYPITNLLSDWKNNSDLPTKKGGNVIDSGPGWSKSATYFITAFTEQYVTVQITEKIDTFTYCGDGTCQENCATCPADCGVCTEEQKLLYNQAPIARFSYTVNGKQVLINDQTRDPDGQIVNKMLSFGDGNSKDNSGTLETYSYTDYGTYTITLFVTDNYGALSKTDAKISVLPATVYVEPETTTTSPSSTTTTGTTTTDTTTGTTTGTVTGTTGSTTTTTTPPTVSGISGGSSTVSNPYSSIVPTVDTSTWTDFLEQKIYLPLTLPLIDRDYVKLWEIGGIVILLGLVLMFRKNFEIKGKGKRRKKK